MAPQKLNLPAKKPLQLGGGGKPALQLGKSTPPAAAKPASPAARPPVTAAGVQTQTRPPSAARPAAQATAAASQRRSLVRPRQRVPQTEYRYRDNTNSAGGIPEGNLCFLRDIDPVQLIRPSWTGKFPTTFRPFPAIDPEDTDRFLPGRYSIKDRDFTDWSRALPLAKFVGMDTKYTFLLYDPRWTQERGYVVRDMNPYHILYWAIKEVVDADNPSAMLGKHDVYRPNWNKIHDKDFNNPRNKGTFFQGAVYQHNEKVYVQGGKPPLGLGRDDIPVIIVMESGSGNDSLNELLMTKPEGVTRADSDDIMGSFVFGDPTLLQGGAFLSFYNPEKQQEAIDFQFSGANSGPSEETSLEDDMEYEDPNVDDDDNRGGKKKRKEFVTWKCAGGHDLYYLNKEMKRKKANNDLTQYEDRIREQYLWWDDLLHFPETEELCEIIARAFRGAPNLLRFGWREHPEFMTEPVKAILAARTQGQGAEVPGDDDDEDEVEHQTTRGGSRSSTLVETELEYSDEELLVTDEEAFVGADEEELDAALEADVAEVGDEVDADGYAAEDADVEKAQQVAELRAALRLRSPGAAPAEDPMAKKKPAAATKKAAPSTKKTAKKGK